MSGGRDPGDERPVTLVAVCGGTGCSSRTESVLAELRPVVRGAPGAVLVRTPCLGGPCDPAPLPDRATRVRVQRCAGGPAGLRPTGPPTDLAVADAGRCARTVAAWLRAGLVLRWRG